MKTLPPPSRRSTSTGSCSRAPSRSMRTGIYACADPVAPLGEDLARGGGRHGSPGRRQVVHVRHRYQWFGKAPKKRRARRSPLRARGRPVEKRRGRALRGGFGWSRLASRFAGPQPLALGGGCAASSRCATGSDWLCDCRPTYQVQVYSPATMAWTESGASLLLAASYLSVLPTTCGFEALVVSDRCGTGDHLRPR